jgi:hypothetical protein
MPLRPREAVREAADGAGLPLSEWLSQAEAKLNADRDAGILAEAERERRRRGLREFLDEYQAEYGAFTEEEMAEASRKLGLSWPPEEDTDERARA